MQESGIKKITVAAVILIIILGFIIAIKGNNSGSSSEQKAAEGWLAVSTTTIRDVTKGQKIQSGLEINATEFSTSTDLTGDGMPEGIFVTWKGAAGKSSNIFQMSPSGIIPLSARDRYGEIGVASLTEATSATYSVGYELLPHEDGFYTFSKTNVSGELNQQKIVCEENGFNAYVWNEDSKLFEWNATLTEAYSNELCI